MPMIAEITDDIIKDLRLKSFENDKIVFTHWKGIEITVRPSEGLDEFNITVRIHNDEHR